MTSLLAIWSAAKTWIVLGLGAVVAAIGAWFIAKKEGAASQAKDDTAAANAQLAVNAQTVTADTVKVSDIRQSVESTNAQLPDAPIQTVADAAPATAAGKLQSEGWTRDSTPDSPKQ